MKKGHPKSNPIHVIAHEAKEKAEQAENKKHEQAGSGRPDNTIVYERQDNAILYEKKQHHPDGPGGNYRGL